MFFKDLHNLFMDYMRNNHHFYALDIDYYTEMF